MNQASLFQELTSAIGQPETVQFLIKVAGISQSMAYRTIKGERKMTFDEGNLFIDYLKERNLLKNTPDKDWKYSMALNTENESAVQFISHLNNKADILNHKSTHLKFTSFEIPIFYYMQSPELLAFKLYFWSRTVWNSFYEVPDIFVPEFYLSEDVINTIQSIYNKYCSVESTEYLNTSMINNTIRQLNYARDIGWFKSIKKHTEIVAMVVNLIDSMRKISASGLKTSPYDSYCSNKITIKKNEVYYTNNIYLIDNSSMKVVFSVLDNPNYLVTTNPAMINRLEQWFADMDTHSSAITEGATRDQKIFFNTMQYNLEDRITL